MLINNVKFYVPDSVEINIILVIQNVSFFKVCITEVIKTLFVLF